VILIFYGVVLPQGSTRNTWHGLEVRLKSVHLSSMTICSTLLPRETARKIQILGKIILDGSKTPFQIAAVPGQRHPDKTTLSVYLPRTLMQRLRRLAGDRGETVTTVIESMVTAQTRAVVLTPEDYEQIARETRAALGKGTTKRRS